MTHRANWALESTEVCNSIDPSCLHSFQTEPGKQEIPATSIPAPPKSNCSTESSALIGPALLVFHFVFLCVKEAWVYWNANSCEAQDIGAIGEWTDKNICKILYDTSGSLPLDGKLEVCRRWPTRLLKKRQFTSELGDQITSKDYYSMKLSKSQMTLYVMFWERGAL